MKTLLSEQRQIIEIAKSICKDPRTGSLRSIVVDKNGNRGIRELVFGLRPLWRRHAYQTDAQYDAIDETHQYIRGAVIGEQMDVQYKMSMGVKNAGVISGKSYTRDAIGDQFVHWAREQDSRLSEPYPADGRSSRLDRAATDMRGKTKWVLAIYQSSIYGIEEIWAYQLTEYDFHACRPAAIDEGPKPCIEGCTNEWCRENGCHIEKSREMVANSPRPCTHPGIFDAKVQE